MPQPAGRPRDPSRGQALVDAVISLLGEVGYQDLTVDQVAARAGTAKTTLYRRWQSKQELVLDAIAHHLGPRTVPRTDDPLDDLRSVVVMVYRQLHDPIAGRALPLLAAEIATDPDMAQRYRDRFVTPLREQALELLHEAVERGMLSPSIDGDLVVDALAAPAVYRPIARGMPATEADAQNLLDLLLDGCRP